MLVYVFKCFFLFPNLFRYKTLYKWHININKFQRAHAKAIAIAINKPFLFGLHL